MHGQAIHRQAINFSLMDFGCRVEINSKALNLDWEAREQWLAHVTPMMGQRKWLDLAWLDLA